MLSSQSKACDEVLVAAHILAAHISQKPSALAHHLEKTTPGCVVFAVDTQVPTQMNDPLGEESYLDFRGTSVPFVESILFNNDLLAVLSQHLARLSAVRSFLCTIP